jgi:hypothetical protein
MGLRALRLHLNDAAGIHDGKIGTQAMTNLLVRGTQLVFEQFQGE